MKYLHNLSSHVPNYCIYDTEFGHNISRYDHHLNIFYNDIDSSSEWDKDVPHANNSDKYNKI